MVDLGSGKGPYGQSFDNYVFIVPALVVLTLVAFCGYKLYNSIQAKEQRNNKKSKKEVKKTQ